MNQSDDPRRFPPPDGEVPPEEGANPSPSGALPPEKGSTPQPSGALPPSPEGEGPSWTSESAPSSTDGPSTPPGGPPSSAPWSTPPTSQAPPTDGRIEITAEELASPEVEQRVQSLREAATPPLIRSVGAPQPEQRGAWWRGGVASKALAGLLGGILGWIPAEVLMSPDRLDGPFADDPAAGTAVWLTLYAIGLAAVLTGWDGIEGRNGAKMLESWKLGIPVTMVGAFIGGFVAQKLYEPFADRAFDRAMTRASDFDEFISMVDGALRIPRGIGFLVAGAVVGVALGVAAKAKQQAINGAIGGAIGGFAGGILFSFVTVGGGAARAVALTVTGVAVGAAIGLVEQARKEVWLEIVNGGMAGKQFILYHDETSIGTAPGCHVTLIKDPHIAPHHASVLRGPAGPEIRAIDSGVPVLVNGQPAQRAPVKDGDQVQVGATLLRLGLREQAMPTVAGEPPR